MGNNKSTNGKAEVNEATEKEIDKLLKNGALSWTTRDVATWLKFHKFDQAAETVLELGIDGECISETPEETLKQWMTSYSHKITEKDYSTLFELVKQHIRASELVDAFVSPNISPTIEITEIHLPKLAKGEWNNQDKFKDLIWDYHNYTYNTTKTGAPTVKRSWILQPKISRRYYGDLLYKLKGCKNFSLENPLLDSLLYYSFSVSAHQDETQKSIWPRTFSSKRVNPSSGGLHPAECYLLHQLNDIYSAAHYTPIHHALEIRSSIPLNAIQTKLPANHFIFAVSGVIWREVWKYGPRGWRYSNLDFGHALGSLGLSANLHDCSIQVLDARSIPDIEVAFCLHTVNQFAENIKDERERELLHLLICVTPRNSTFNFYTEGVQFITEVINYTKEKANPVGIPNATFNRADTHMHWPFVEAIETMCTYPTPIPNELIKIDVENEIVPGLYSDKKQLANCIRTRRSVLNFHEKAVSAQKFARCLAACMSNANSLVGESLQFNCSINPALSNVSFGIWVNDVASIKPGLYFLVRNAADLETLQGEYRKNYPDADPWQLVQDSNIPSWLPLYFVSGTLPEIRKSSSDASCYQQIAQDCAFVVGMFVNIANSLKISPNYAHIHWEAGFLGQLLYVQATLENLGATGMGCFLDDLSMEIFGLTNTFYPLYHFAIGDPKRDNRYTPFEY